MKTYPVYLNGNFELREPGFPVVNPATGVPIGRMSFVPGAVVAEAVAHAHEAFDSWRQFSGKARGEWLQKIAAELEQRGEEIAVIITLENGKPLAQSQSEVAMAVDHLRWFGEEARRAYGRVVPHQAEGKRHLVMKTPVGVVGAISPWNFPLMLGVRKVAPALAAGCPVILKPASQTPFSAVAFAECVHAAGLPRGVFQLVAGKASEIGAEFLQNRLVRKVTFTGSTEVGKKLITGAAEQVKGLSLELGGHAPVLVFDDADPAAAVEGVLNAKFRNAGQSCIAANRVYVQRSIYEKFVELLAGKTRSLVVGDGLKPQTQIGPMIDSASLDKALEHVRDAVNCGAELLCGGERLPGPGWFLQPAVLRDVPSQALCMREETFAPVLPVCAFDTESEAVSLANDSAYGLSAYVFTRDLGRMFRVAEALEAGIIGINDGLPTATQAPFGGVKQSGWGRELGLEGMDAFLDTKHVSIVL